MNNYDIRIEIQEGEVKEILDKLNEAQETIYNCYNRLQEIGVLTLKEKPTVVTDVKCGGK